MCSKVVSSRIILVSRLWLVVVGQQPPPHPPYPCSSTNTWQPQHTKPCGTATASRTTQANMSGFGSSISTPRRLRPNLRPAESSPNLSFSASSIARQASLSALTGGASPSPNSMADGQDIDIGDSVDVPGGMHGVVKFVGSIRGKKGVFAGVELSRAFASRGKNDGAVDGTQYFTTTVPGSGIFLPVHRALKRSSGTSDDFIPTPTTPSYANNNFSLSTTEKPNFSPNTPSVSKSQFSQSLGPGARARRPSLPRPESPLRKASNLAPPTPPQPSHVPA